MTDNPWVTPGATGGNLEPNPWVNPPRSCDFCQGLGEVPVEGGGRRQCPYCHGECTDRWRQVVNERRHVAEARKYFLVKWAAILCWPAWIFALGIFGANLILLMGGMAGCWYLFGWAMRNLHYKQLRQPHSGIGSPTAPYALGGLALFAVMRNRHRHSPGNPLDIKPPWQ